MIMRKQRSLYDLLTLRAMYNKELHDAIMSEDSDFVMNYINNYDNDDRDFYDFTLNIDIKELKRLTAAAAAEYETAFASGNRIMGM